MNLEYPTALQSLILQLKRLPGIGSRSAERMSLWLLQQPSGALTSLAEVLVLVEREIRPCESCGFFATPEGCAICCAPDRDPGLLCIVEQPTDILPIERTGAFRGHYHALGGRLAPLDNVGPEDLRIGELMERIEIGAFEEVVLATGADVAGEATANYLAEILRSSKVRLTRLAQGMPVGGGLDTADSLTLHRAFQHRRNLSTDA
ncbi:MAG: recombination protein RecR [Verrucomicrobia bacterium]|nr:MAG: recombination protein RecR [Verrucomicrobiota bacterium]